ncbi:hypothetical protein [Marimonas lutisalis]|uniref:hypothetical protein n=1 Tax=Marimonas lutisalis TaxID=2545756 RepID=UPI001960D930|nr:hypothetical protein [Marimonas lutisalis]
MSFEGKRQIVPTSPTLPTKGGREWRKVGRVGKVGRVSDLSGKAHLARDHFEERAAIREFDGGQTRTEAERAALSEAAAAVGLAPETLQSLWAHSNQTTKTKGN